MAIAHAVKAHHSRGRAHVADVMARKQALLLLLCLATTAVCKERPHPLGRGDEDIAGPVVRSHSKDRVAVLPTSSGNLTLLVNGTIGGEEKKKTIAQIIDEALEQEFPEEKPEKIGKNYNETALQEDVS